MRMRSEEVECLRRKAWPDSTSRDDQTFTRMDVDVDPTPAQKRGESMGAAFAIDDIDVSAPMPLTRRSHLRTTAGTHDRAYFVRGPGDKKVLSADKEPHEVNSISRDDGAPEPSGNDVDELFVVDEHTSGGSNNEDDNDDGVIDSVSADQLDRDPRVRDYDDRGMIQCLGQGHWVPRNEWEVHAQDCEPLFAELTVRILGQLHEQNINRLCRNCVDNNERSIVKPWLRRQVHLIRSRNGIKRKLRLTRAYASFLYTTSAATRASTLLSSQLG